MDCNKDEALGAKEVAESKFKAHDIVGAKNYALKAQNLLPSLEGIDQMIATLDIYLAAETKIMGECDWYAILSVDGSADDESLKKNYRRLALQLHPDKNKSIGAEGAFKLISEAWSVLSDKTRKMAYDESRSNNGYHNKASQKQSTSAPGSVNGFYEFSHTTNSRKRARKNSTASPPCAAPSNPNTFWTSCNRCRMQYEYLRVYVNHNLLCPNCNQAFLAVEIGIPASVISSSGSLSSKQHYQNMNYSTTNNGHYSGFTTSTCPGTEHMEFQYSTQNSQQASNPPGGACTTDPSLMAANKIQRKMEKLRRKQEKAQAAARSAEALGNYYSATNTNVYDKGNLDFTRNCHVSEHKLPKQSSSRLGRPPKIRANSIDGSSFNHGGDEARKFTLSGAPVVERTASSFSDCPKTRVTSRHNSFSPELSQVNIRQLLMEKVKLSISQKLGEWNLQKQEKLRFLEKTNQLHNGKYNCSENVTDQVVCEKNGQTQLHDSTKKNSPNCPIEVRKPISIDVPDPDFYDFDKNRLENSFECDQVWATYDNDDGMPRFYVFIQKVLSQKPFKVRMSFLTSKSNSEFGSMNWIASGFAKTCGNFRVSRYEIGDTINIFSHRVRWEKGARGNFKILPKKSDTWALYRNWSPEWNELTPNDVIHKYEIVEVVDDYDDERGVIVTPLVKVAGFKAVFHRHLDPNELRRIPCEEMFRFSHQVPSYLLTGAEAHNALKGCRELDPAATPWELLQVITDLKDDAGVEAKNQQVDS